MGGIEKFDRSQLTDSKSSRQGNVYGLFKKKKKRLQIKMPRVVL